MRKIEFYKLQASGNDFILIEAQSSRLRQGFGGQAPLTAHSLRDFAKKYCERKRGVGADGLLVIEPSKRVDFKMRIFNPDGSEVEMCGNGARCVALWASKNSKGKDKKKKLIKFETKAGIIESRIRSQQEVGIKLTEPFNLKLDLPIKVFARTIKINYINTGVPHSVIFAQGLDKIDIEKIGREIRFHREFRPQGTNVNFVEVLGDDLIRIRTYERGVEGETLACGTGGVAGAVITNYKLQTTNYKQRWKVLTRGGETLRVYFNRKNNKINDLWLEGGAYLVYKGGITLC